MAPLAILVGGLHAALLAMPVRSVRPDHASVQTGQMQVRLISSSAAQTSPAPAPEPQSEPTSLSVAAPAATPEVQAEAVAATAATGPASAPQSASPASASPPTPSFGLIVPGGDRDADYFPRALLSLAPIPLDTVVIGYPPIENDRGHHVSELTLFIDETGRVARVRVDGAALPPALEDAARRAFVEARFRPGEADGRAVKSQIRVEVVFDNRPPGRP